jgi:hypothetical protein
MKSYTATAPHASFSGASTLKKVRHSTQFPWGSLWTSCFIKKHGGKAFRQDFYWPTAAGDATHIMRSYSGYQYFLRQIHAPTQELQTIPITWMFAMWGLDLLGPFKKAPGGLTHLLVVDDKFTKWIEEWPLVNINSRQAVNFM